MTEKEVKRLSRSELLELLINQGKKIERLQAQIVEQNMKLEARKIDIDGSGSIAEAALKITGVYTAAQEAADVYLENVERVCREKSEEAEKDRAEAAKLLAETEAFIRSFTADLDKLSGEPEEIERIRWTLSNAGKIIEEKKKQD